MVLHCPSYSQALKWARLECKSYKIPQPDIEPLISEPEIEPLSGPDHDEELPLFFARSPKQLIDACSRRSSPDDNLVINAVQRS